MFYAEAVVKPLGDLYVTVEFGDELSLELNFRVIALDRALREARVAGVTETIPTTRSLGVVYDPLTLSRERLVARLRELERSATAVRAVPSRHVTIPIWYDDPWSRECAAAHGAPNNVALLAELNGMTVADVIRTHAGTDHWVSAVGFTPACYQALPLDPSKALTAPKYQRPRKWTPERILCIAGQLTSFYPVASPGGYQLLGRTPIELYDPKQQNPVFRDSPVLPRVGDRHTYVPIDEATYREIRREVDAGAYRYQIEEDTYRLDDYLARVEAMKRGRSGT
ncbi:MAG: allophanate hydrolase subunit 1 [Candidatus Rokubacteria bacterium]|nr:allophanate hydrolase subunit 1 [Candidatus Rokubacteria bacterium]